MKYLTLPKLTLGLLFFCLLAVCYLLFARGENRDTSRNNSGEANTSTGTQKNQIINSDDKYAKLVSEFLMNFENNTLENTPKIVSSQFVFENLLGKRYATQEYISAFRSLRNNCIEAKQTIDSIAVLTSPHQNQGKSVSVWFTEKITKKDGHKTTALFHDLFRFDTNDKIIQVKMFIN